MKRRLPGATLFPSTPRFQSKAGRESDEDQRVGEHADPASPRWAKVAGLRRTIYENSLVIVMAAIWIGTWLADRKSTRLNSSHATISYAVFCLKKTNSKQQGR